MMSDDVVVSEAVLSAGARLATCAFNLAQRPHLTDAERRSLTESRQDWDDALSALSLHRAAPQPEPTPLDGVVEALRDALSGWRYIREHHGDLYGVGWDRVEQSLTAALSLQPAQQAPAEQAGVEEQVARLLGSDPICNGRVGAGTVEAIARLVCTPASQPDAETVERVSLAECPEGLFWFGDTLCMKTEYGSNEGRIDAYIVESGEAFWGPQPQSVKNQRALLVTPIDTAFAIAALSSRGMKGE